MCDHAARCALAGPCVPLHGRRESEPGRPSTRGPVSPSGGVGQHPHGTIAGDWLTGPLAPSTTAEIVRLESFLPGMTKIRLTTRREQARRALRAVVLLPCALAYFAATFGMPVELAAEKAKDKPFPCQHHQCGCQTREQCLRHCCCLSHGQKVAWYRNHDLALPGELMGVGDDEHDEPASPMCCRRKATRQTENAGSQVVLAFQANRCQGHVTFWVTAGAVLPLAPPPVVAAAPAAADWIALARDLSASADQVPPDPPPRLAVA